MMRFESAGSAVINLLANGNAQLDGVVSSPASDVAEWESPWWDGNLAAEDRHAMSVVLVRADDTDVPVLTGDDGHEDTLIRPAIHFADLPQDILDRAIEGVASDNPALLLGPGEMYWPQKFLKDPLGRHLTELAGWVTWRTATVVLEGQQQNGEDEQPRQWTASEEASFFYFLDQLPEGVEPPVGGESLDEAVQRAVRENRSAPFDWVSPPTFGESERRVLNPAFDPSLDYTPRSERPAWPKVSQTGQVAVRDGHPRKSTWRKVRTLSPGVSLWRIG